MSEYNASIGFGANPYLAPNAGPNGLISGVASLISGGITGAQEGGIGGFFRGLGNPQATQAEHYDQQQIARYKQAWAPYEQDFQNAMTLGATGQPQDRQQAMDLINHIYTGMKQQGFDATDLYTMMQKQVDNAAQIHIQTSGLSGEPLYEEITKWQTDPTKQAAAGANMGTVAHGFGAANQANAAAGLTNQETAEKVATFPWRNKTGEQQAYATIDKTKAESERERGLASQAYGQGDLFRSQATNLIPAEARNYDATAGKSGAEAAQIREETKQIQETGHYPYKTAPTTTGGGALLSNARKYADSVQKLAYNLSAGPKPAVAGIKDYYSDDILDKAIEQSNIQSAIYELTTGQTMPYLTRVPDPNDPTHSMAIVTGRPAGMNFPGSQTGGAAAPAAGGGAAPAESRQTPSSTPAAQTPEPYTPPAAAAPPTAKLGAAAGAAPEFERFQVPGAPDLVRPKPTPQPAAEETPPKRQSQSGFPMVEAEAKTQAAKLPPMDLTPTKELQQRHGITDWFNAGLSPEVQSKVDALRTQMQQRINELPQGPNRMQLALQLQAAYGRKIQAIAGGGK